MEKDIIMDALYRFQEIVESERPSKDVRQSDRRLAHLAIKKFKKTTAWRSSLPRYQSQHQELFT